MHLTSRCPKRICPKRIKRIALGPSAPVQPEATTLSFESEVQVVVCPRASVVLLAVFTVLAQERNVTRAATRLLLSQRAVSRALQRLRDMFHDHLLIRSSSGYEPTPNGQRLLHELETSLPRLDRLLSGSDFDPATEETSFRIAATDHACH